METATRKSPDGIPTGNQRFVKGEPQAGDVGYCGVWDVAGLFLY